MPTSQRTPQHTPLPLSKLEQAQALTVHPFELLIMAAMLHPASEDDEVLIYAYPHIWQELKAEAFPTRSSNSSGESH